MRSISRFIHCATALALTLTTLLPLPFSSPTAHASGGGLRVNMDQIQVRVERFDETSVTSDDFGILDTSVKTVYINGVSVTNTSNRTINFHIDAFLGFGQSAFVNLGAETNLSSYLYPVGPGATFYIARDKMKFPRVQNWSGIWGSGGLYARQALGGVNTNSLIIDTWYTDTSVFPNLSYSTHDVADPVLKWAAVRVTLLDLTGQPIVNRTPSLTREGSINPVANYVGPNGQHGYALLEQGPGVYTAKLTANPDIILSPQIYVSDPVFQDVTFRMSACTRPEPPAAHNLLGVETAHAEECVVDLVSVIDENARLVWGSSGGEVVQPLLTGGHIAAEFTSLKLRGLKIKNAGTSAAIGNTVTSIAFGGLSSDVVTPITLNLAANQEIVVPDIQIPDTYLKSIKNVVTAASVSGYPAQTDDYFLPMGYGVNTNKNIPESDYSNNGSVVEEAILWSGIRVKIENSDNDPEPNVIVKLTEQSGFTSQSVSNIHGIAILSPLLSLRNGPKTYKISTYIGDKLATDPFDITLSELGVVEKSITVGARLSIIPMQNFEHGILKESNLYPPTAGEVTLKSAKGKLYTAQVTNGAATFPSDLPADKYTLVKSSTSLTYKATEGEITVAFNWPEKSREGEVDHDPTFPPNITYPKGTSLKYNVLLPKECTNLPEVKLDICWYDETAYAKQNHKKVLDIFSPVLKKMKLSFKNAASNLTTVNLAPLPYLSLSGGDSIYGYYVTTKSTSVTIDPRVSLFNAQKSQFTVAHELFHLLDHHNGDSPITDSSEFASRASDSYTKSRNIQMNSETGSLIWDKVVNGCVWMGCSIYDSNQLGTLSDISPEMFAQERASMCIKNIREPILAIMNSKATLEAFWREKVSPTIPPDLEEQRLNIMYRLTGVANSTDKLESLTATWFADCATTIQ